MSFVALFVVGTLAVHCGFFYLLARVLQMGVPFDAVRAGLHRTGLGAAATILSLVIHIFLRMALVPVETIQLTGLILIWLMRVGIWIFVATWVYRVTRWRKGKLALSVVAGLALNFAIDYGQSRLGADLMPAFGSWAFRFC